MKISSWKLNAFFSDLDRYVDAKIKEANNSDPRTRPPSTGELRLSLLVLLDADEEDDLV